MRKFPNRCLAFTMAFTAGWLAVTAPAFPAIQPVGSSAPPQASAIAAITVSTDFVNGGGTVQVISQDPPTVRLQPHDEGNGGWSQVWWHFRVEGVEPGQNITIELDRGDPECAGVSPQAWFSYDGNTWGLTHEGRECTIEGRRFFVYNHTVRSHRVWFAYDLPYTPDNTAMLMQEAEGDAYAEIFELCKTKQGHPVPAIRLHGSGRISEKPYGIFLQARTHAFETGGSWVLDGLTRWLMSADPKAEALRACAVITIVPIVDVDGVLEGRTGKNHPPHDHNRGWDREPAYWPETAATKTLLTQLATDDMLDMFIDFHGPGNTRHPYFIIAQAHTLPHALQRSNRQAFFDILEARPLDMEAEKSQSMTKLYYSARPWDGSVYSSRDWTIREGNDHTISLTIEVNMNTPLSTEAGYAAEGATLGAAIAEYFADGHHNRQE